jgi:hypothetical protein
MNEYISGSVYVRWLESILEQAIVGHLMVKVKRRHCCLCAAHAATLLLLLMDWIFNVKLIYLNIAHCVSSAWFYSDSPVLSLILKLRVLKLVGSLKPPELERGSRSHVHDCVRTHTHTYCFLLNGICTELGRSTSSKSFYIMSQKLKTNRVWIPTRSTFLFNLFSNTFYIISSVVYANP